MKRRISQIPKMAGAFLFLVSLLPASGQFINGSFEGGSGGYALLPGGSTVINGWTTTLNGVEWFNPASYGSGSAYNGNMIVDLAVYTYTGGGIKQSIPTIPGESYQLSYAGGTHAGFGRNGTGSIELQINGVGVATNSLLNLTGTVVWNTFNYNFTASSTSTLIEFRNTQNANLHFAYLDGIGVTQVPEPTAGMLAASAALGLLLRRKTAKRD